MMDKKVTEKKKGIIYNFFNNKRSMKCIVEFLLFVLAAFSGATFSTWMYTKQLSLIHLRFLMVLFLLVVIAIFIFRDWYETPSRRRDITTLEFIDMRVESMEEDIKEIHKKLDNLKNIILSEEYKK